MGSEKPHTVAENSWITCADAATLGPSLLCPFSVEINATTSSGMDLSAGTSSSTYLTVCTESLIDHFSGTLRIYRSVAAHRSIDRNQKNSTVTASGRVAARLAFASTALKLTRLSGWVLAGPWCLLAIWPGFLRTIRVLEADYAGLTLSADRRGGLTKSEASSLPPC
jgi:hypothetical protein